MVSTNENAAAALAKALDEIGIGTLLAGAPRKLNESPGRAATREIQNLALQSVACGRNIDLALTRKQQGTYDENGQRPDHRMAASNWLAL